MLVGQRVSYIDDPNDTGTIISYSLDKYPGYPYEVQWDSAQYPDLEVDWYKAEQLTPIT